MKTLNFDMDALRTMVVGVDLGGFAHAAARLNRSPSAVSMQLRKLENQAGQRLFKRSGRGLALTQAGELLLQHARRVLALNDEMGLALGAIKDGGTVRVGISQDFADAILQHLLLRYARVRPATHVEVRAGRTCGLADEVANGRIDLALAWAPMGQGAGDRIARIPASWVGLAKKSDRAPVDRVVPLVVFDNPCFFRDMAIEALSRARLSWRLAMTTPSLADLWCGVRAGLGVAVRTALFLPRDVAIVPASTGLPALPPIDIVLYSTPSLSAAAQEFRDILLETATRECRINKAVTSKRPRRRDR
ncbi:MAG TPA: LysR family transcriptional regulator [Steroidobacteraceae bacterium]|nr:LysR family transcriptional regulator [Steroidobacteraceae bacterium]